MADALLFINFYYLFINFFPERKERVFRERIEMADMSETQIRSRFRFRQETIIFISNLLRNDLERPCGNAGNLYTLNVCFVFPFWVLQKKSFRTQYMTASEFFTVK